MGVDGQSKSIFGFWCPYPKLLDMDLDKKFRGNMDLDMDRIWNFIFGIGFGLKKLILDMPEEKIYIYI